MTLAKILLDSRRSSGFHFSLNLVAILVIFSLSAVARGQIAPFLDTFEDPDVFATGRSPVTWGVSADNPLNREAEVVNGEFVLAAANNDDGSVFVEQFVGFEGDISVRARVRMLSTLDSGGIYARGDNGSYFAGIASSGFVFLGDNDGNPALLLSERAIADPRRDVDIQIDVTGNTVSVTAWDSRNPMPDSPLLSFTDDPTPRLSGTVGLWVNPMGGEGSMAFDDFQVIPELMSLACDFTGDGLCDGSDINRLMADAATGGTDTDLNGDGVVDNTDRDEWLMLAGEENGFAEPVLVGDSDINGTVDAIDLNALALSWRDPDDHNWTSGNFSVAGGPGVNAADLNALALNWRASSAAASQAVPEPSTFGLMLLALTLLMGSRMRRTGS
jgi:hypothetical protein